ncbi:3-oxoacyl-[acyl-carrier protein] reductase, partial [hydrothermal vent metagenome]
MTKRLENKVALITGAANGIGYAIADLFACEGASLILLDMEYNDLKSRISELEAKYDVNIIGKKADISDRAAVQKAIGDAIAEMGSLDILINNAGRNIFSQPMDLSQEDWINCFNINLSGSWHCIQAVLPHMLKRKYGNIVNISSVHAHKIIPQSFPYPVFKHGLTGLTKSLGIEYASAGIRVNSISPGLILTPGTEAYFDSCPSPDEERKR